MRLPNVEKLIDRAPSFPINYCLYSWDFYDPDSETPRILLCHYDNFSGKLYQGLRDKLRPTDIVFVPLYGGMKLKDRCQADDTSQRIEFYDENIEFINDVASSVRGILVGNCGPELSFKHLWLRDQSQPREMMSRWMCDFAEDTNEIIANAGGTPVYGTIDWDIAVDYHYSDAMFRDKCNELNAIQICFCGYQLFGVAQDGPSPIVPHPADCMFFPCCPKDEMMPKKGFQEYLRGGEIWTGVHGKDGLMNGNDIKLSSFGFKAGVMEFGSPLLS